jgi:hypothetical protein
MVIVDDVRFPKILQNEPFIALKERDLIEALKETVQSPPLRPFQKDHITWLPHATSMHGLYNQTEITIIPWDWLEHFV